MEYLGKSIDEGRREEYLDITTVPEYKEITRVAYVHDVSVGFSKTDSGFVKFFLKDCNANVVPAILFDVADFMLSGINAAAFKHRAVKFTCVVQNYKGKPSIVIDGKEGISLYDGEFDYSRFIGHVPYSLDELNGYCLRYGAPGFESTLWSSTSLEQISRGRTGAYGRIVEMAFSSIKPVIDSMSSDEAKELLGVFVVAVDYNFRYLKERQHLDVIGELGVCDFVSQISQRFRNDDSKLLYVDTLNALSGLTAPKHLFAHVVFSAFEYAKKILQLQAQFASMPIGTKSYVGGVELSKY